MRGNQIRLALVPVALAASLGACASNGVAPGYVTGPSRASASQGSYGGGTPTGETGRVVAINDVALRGGSSGGPGGMSNNAVSGGLIGAAGGTAMGAVAGRSVGGALIGAVLGAVGGAIAGTIVDRQGGGTTGRGIEVTVQKDDGQTIRVAQRDDGDVQLGDRVAIVQDRNGAAKAVHDNSRAPDSGSQYGGPPPQDMQSSSNNQRYVPRGPDYPPSQNGGQYGGSQYNGPQDGVPPAEYGQQSRNSQSRYAPRPQDDPRYGNLD